MVGNVASLVKTLGGAHSRTRGKTETSICFNLESGSSKGDGAVFRAFGLLDALYRPILPV